MAKLKLAVKPGANDGLAQGELILPKAYSPTLAGALGDTVVFVDEPAGAGEAFAWGELQSLHATEDRGEVIAAFSRIEEFTTPFALPMTGDIEDMTEFEWLLSLGKTGQLILVYPPVESGFGEDQQADFAISPEAADLLSLYGERCAVTGAPLVNKNGIRQLEAVYLRPLDEGGTSTPANAIVAQRLVAWAVRSGHITFEDDYSIDVRQAPVVSLPPINASGQLRLPVNKAVWPDREALRYHREHIALKASDD